LLKHFKLSNRPLYGRCSAKRIAVGLSVAFGMLSALGRSRMALKMMNNYKLAEDSMLEARRGKNLQI